MSSFRAPDRALHRKQPQPLDAVGTFGNIERGRYWIRAATYPTATAYSRLRQNYLSVRRQSLEGCTATAGLRTIAGIVKAELATDPAAELGSRKLRLSRQQPADPLQRLRHAQTLLDKILCIHNNLANTRITYPRPAHYL